MMEIVNALQSRNLLAGVVVAEGVVLEDAPAGLKSLIETLLAERREKAFPPDELKAAVRNLLRTSAYKPTGRSKPASEYLGQAAGEGRFPFINNLVDVNNYLSLLSGLPISLLDFAVTTPRILLRDGAEGEKYVFNEGGQEIELNGLISVCRVEGASSVPLGTPVKDSMAGKLKPHTKEVVGIIYAPGSYIKREELDELVSRFGALLEQFGKGRVVERLLV